MEVCSKCGSLPIFKAVHAGTYDDSDAIERIPVRCSNPLCEYSDERLLDYDWLTKR